MRNYEKPEWHAWVAILRLHDCDRITERFMDDSALIELLEAINEREPGLNVDQYLS